MRIHPRNAVQRILSVSLAAFALAGAALPASAQRAPELLPAQVSLVAGGGSALTAGKCALSGITATDSYGDGCLATEIILGGGTATPGPRWAVADANGNVFFSDFANNLIRRVDASTGIITAVAGGGTTPAVGGACGTGISVDALGDGCPANKVALLHPTGLAFAPNGDLYFSEADYATSTAGGAHVRKIAATSGFITTTGTITLVLGQASNAKGYAANASTCTATVTTGCVTAANSYLYAPYGISTDAAGNLFIADYYKEAMLVYNPGTTAVTLNNIVVPGGTIGKLVGALTGPVQDCPNSPASTNGCSYGLTTFGGQATTSFIDSSYAVAPDAAGNLFYANEYYNYIGKVSTSGVLTQFAGIQNAAARVTTRAAAGANGIGSPFGIATDKDSNVYFGDASNGVIFRVDADTSTQYVIAGGATVVCAAATDSFGDGCPATQSTFGSSAGTGKYASVTLPGPGIYGVTVDKYGNLFTADTETNSVREVGTGAQFGTVGGTNTLQVHFAPGDGPATATPYVITTNPNNFALGTPGTCVTNADNSKDCPVPLKATPTIVGAYSGVLTVTSALGKTAAFPLSGIYVVSRVTRTAVTLASGVTCTGSTNYSSTGTLTLTANVTSSGAATGQVQFYNNVTTPIGSPVTLSAAGTAVLSQKFPTGSYSITAVYSGDANFNPSTSATPVVFTTSPSSYALKYSVITPATGTTPNCTSTATAEGCTIPVGGTATYSFTLSQVLYSGTVSFACSGLPSGATCIFSPQTLVGTGCSTVAGTSTTVGTEPVVAMTVTTSKTQQLAVHAGFGGRWMLLSVTLCGVLLAFTRRRMSVRFGQISMAVLLLVASAGLMACNTTSIGSPSTPKGTSTIVVTASGSDGSIQTLPVTLTIQ